MEPSVVPTDRRNPMFNDKLGIPGILRPEEEDCSYLGGGSYGPSQLRVSPPTPVDRFQKQVIDRINQKWAAVTLSQYRPHDCGEYVDPNEAALLLNLLDETTSFERFLQGELDRLERRPLSRATGKTKSTSSTGRSPWRRFLDG